MPLRPASLSDRCPSPSVRNGVRALPPSRKGADAPLFRLDEALRFEGYASVFGQMDLGRDVVMPGAFARSLGERGPGGVRLLWQHDPDRPIGAWESLTEDRHGLFVRGRLDPDLPQAQTARRLISAGRIDGLSIGYRTQIARREPATGLRRLERVDLWEISVVAFPLLPQARLRPLNSGAP